MKQFSEEKTDRLKDRQIGLIKLGPRLKKIASFVPQGARLGDIGTDHAYLPVFLLQKGIISGAVGVDIHKGPYESARQTVKSYGLSDRIALRLGNGLKPLLQGEVDTLSIAGMGGTTILEILNSNASVMRDVTELVLQPQGAEARVRTELLAQGWLLRAECLVEEDDRIYTVICFSRTEGLNRKEIEAKVGDLLADLKGIKGHNPGQVTGHNSAPSDPDEILQTLIWQLGPLILLKRERGLDRILRDSIKNNQNVIQEMSKAEREHVRLQAEGLKKEIMMMEGMRTWLYQ